MKPKVLLVENDLDITRMYQYKFSKNDFQTDIAKDGQECFEVLERDTPDVIVLDLRMPVVDGFEVLSRVRSDQQWEKVPVIVLTSRDEPKEIERALELGATDCLVKHRTKPEDVALKIQQVLAQPTVTHSVERYRIPIDPYADETAELVRDFGLSYNLQCGTCRRTLVLEMVPDLSREEPWFSSHFVCPHCTPKPIPTMAKQGAHCGDNPAR